jgi:hypothetical protein
LKILFNKNSIFNREVGSMPINYQNWLATQIGLDVLNELEHVFSELITVGGSAYFKAWTLQACPDCPE